MGGGRWELQPLASCCCALSCLPHTNFSTNPLLCPSHPLRMTHTLYSPLPLCTCPSPAQTTWDLANLEGYWGAVLGNTGWLIIEPNPYWRGVSSPFMQCSGFC